MTAKRTDLEEQRMLDRLARLPRLQDAYQRGALVYSAVRSLCQVATAATEQAWIDAAVGKTVRAIARLVAGKRRGDLPARPRAAPPEPVRPVILVVSGQPWRWAGRTVRHRRNPRGREVN